MPNGAVAARASTSGSKAFLSNMQVLRFVAAFMVLISHLDREVGKGGAAGRGVALFDRLAVPWSCGVDLFFVISGFIMLYLTWGSFAKLGYWREFLKRRVIRVVPLYWIFTLLFAFIAVLQPRVVSHAEITGPHLLGSLFFIPYARAGGGVYPVLALGWTLNYEVMFYLAFAVMLWVASRLRAARGMALWTLAAVFFFASLFNLVTPVGPLVIRFWTNPVIMEFIFGVLIAALHLRGVKLPMAARVVCVATGFGLLIAAGQFGIADTESHVSSLPRSVWAGMPCALIVAGAIFGPQLGMESRWVRVLVLGGDASYSLYLTHMFATRSLTVAWRLLGLTEGGLFMAVGAAAALALAVGVFLWIETPVLHLLRKRFEPSRSFVAA